MFVFVLFTVRLQKASLDEKVARAAAERAEKLRADAEAIERAKAAEAEHQRAIAAQRQREKEVQEQSKRDNAARLEVCVLLRYGSQWVHQLGCC